MKRIFTIAAALLMTVNLLAQAPEKMSYQAVVRNASNSLITSQALGMQISILQGGAAGTAVYVETQSPTTNANGLVSLEIGTGTLVSGNFTTIDWANDTFFIKTETDPTGGTSYTITGTSQLLSVPYALYAKTSGSSSNAVYAPTATFIHIADIPIDGTINFFDVSSNTSNTPTTWAWDFGDGNTSIQQHPSNTYAVFATYTVTLIVSNNAGTDTTTTNIIVEPPAIGGFYQGGVIFYILQVGDVGYVAGETHGLICDVNALQRSQWGCNGTTISGADGEAIGTGKQNTIDIEAGCSTTNTAADRCANLTLNGYSDWFLPSIGELSKMDNNRLAFNTAALLNGGSSIMGNIWSSTEENQSPTQAYFLSNGSSGGWSSTSKGGNFRVRAVRAF